MTRPDRARLVVDVVAWTGILTWLAWLIVHGGC